jgi:hypothetical protein
MSLISVKSCGRLGLLLVLPLVATHVAAQSRLQGKQAVPIDPVAAILETFRSRALVALGEGHGRAPDQAFRLKLIRDPRFSSTVDDIVVESGSAEFQEVVDRFMLGENVPDESLRKVWLNAAEAFHDPMYEAFFRAVRTVNDGLPLNRRIRVLLGEEPRHRNRDGFVADVIRREVLAKGRRALVIYGNAHVVRMHSVTEGLASGTLVDVLERAGDTRVFSIWSDVGTELPKLQSTIRDWPTPSLALVRGTVLGLADFAFYMPFGGWRLRDDGQPILVNGAPVADPPRRGLRMEEQVDAVLYLGR